jgi:hypothetical protein
MGIRIFSPPDPGAPSSRHANTILIGSAGAEQLERELLRYCEGAVEGRSFLISGHRGAGKTTMVNQCVQNVEKTEGLRSRPLLIRVHGPNLVRDLTGEDEPQDAAGDAGTSSTTAANNDRARTSAPSSQDDKKTATTDSSADTAAGGGAPTAAPATTTGTGNALAALEYARKLQVDANREKHPKRRKVQLALQQITLALHRALADKLTEAYRDRVTGLGMDEVTGQRRRQLYERAAQLALELDQYTTPDRLRQFWAAGDFLETGVLPTRENRRDQGFRELVALSAACQAYGRVSGTFANAEVKQSINNSQTTSLSTAKEGLDLISPVLSIVIGGLTGTAMFSAGGAVQSTAAGLIAALGSAAVFKYSSSRSRTRTYSSDLTFVPDMRLDTLDRVLPTLIQRVSDIGLAPVFVIDELDKIDNLYTQLESIVQHVKTIVAERAFFCFLTDRAYFERVVNVDVRDPYPKHFTYFTDRVFVSFQPTNLRTYLGELLQTEARVQALRPAAADPQAATPAPAAAPTAPVRDDDADDLDVLKYVLLRRSEMHAVRLRRQIASWSKNGQYGPSREPLNTVLFERGVIRQLTRYRFDLLVQLAIDSILRRPYIANRLRDDPAFARLIYDALYYPIRLLAQGPGKNGAPVNAPANGRPVLTIDVADREAFDDYLVERMSSDPGEAKDPDAPPLNIQAVDSMLLLAQVRDLVAMLADPYVLLDELAANKYADVNEAVLSALPLNPDDGPLLVARLGTPHLYEWRYDHDWNILG